MQNFSSGLPSDTKTQVGGLANNVAALLAYFPCIAVIASIVWLVTEPKSNTFLRFHAVQSLLFGAAIAVICIVLAVGLSVVNIIIGQISGVLAGLVGLLGFLVMCGVSLLALGGYVLCMMKAYQGQIWKLPVVGELAEKYSR
jgi:uncharacterized membrane protein